jgi:hypothetical protein
MGVTFIARGRMLLSAEAGFKDSPGFIRGKDIAVQNQEYLISFRAEVNRDGDEAVLRRIEGAWSHTRLTVGWSLQYWRVRFAGLRHRLLTGRQTIGCGRARQSGASLRATTRSGDGDRIERKCHFAMCACAQSREQNICERPREEIVTASRDETNAPQDAHRTISALAAGRPARSRISFTSLIVPRK